MNQKLYIRSIQNRFEKIPMWVVIDSMSEEINRDYFLATQIYRENGSILTRPKANEADAYHLRGEFFSTPEDRKNKMFRKNPADKYKLPDITMYCELGMRLKMEGLIFNKKTCEIKRKGEN